MFSQSGVFRCFSFAARKGVYGMFEAFMHGKVLVTYSAGLNFFPLHVR